MSIKRRDFLKQSLFIVGAASSSKWVLNALSAGEEDILTAPSGPGIESWKISTCQLCPGGCGIRVRLIDGQPVKIEGNPGSPINRGGLCPTGHSGLQVLFNPDRIKSPLKRVGPRGSGEWQQISWAEALQTVSRKLKDLRTKNAPHHLLLLHGEVRGLLKDVFALFMKAYGSPNLISTGSGIRRPISLALMQGKTFSPAYDFANTKFILSFGNDFLGTEGPPAWMAKMFGQMRQNRKGYRVKIVQVESRFSMTAAKADKWLPVNPGTAAALALGIAYVLIIEERFDKQYIDRYTFGFEDWVDDRNQSRPGFKSLVLRDYYPEKVSQVTGISVDDIIRVARSFSENRPAIALFGKEILGQTNGLHTQMAIHSLNALVGSLGKSGGVIEQPQYFPSSLPAPLLDDIAHRGLQQSRIDVSPGSPNFFDRDDLSQLIENLVSGNPYPIEVAFIYGTNPLFETPQPTRVKEALSKIHLLVSFSSFMDETAAFSDLILPDHTYLEKWDLDYGVPHIPFLHVGLSQPVVEPRFKTRHTGDIMIQLAKSLPEIGSGLQAYDSYLELLRQQIQATFHSGRGFIPSTEFEEFLFSYLLKRGFTYQKHNTFKEFWAQLIQRGSWVEFPALPIERIPRFATQTRKFEFYSLEIEKKFEDYLHSVQRSGNSAFIEELQRYNLAIDKAESRLPQFVEPAFLGAKEEYPLYLKPFNTITLFNGEGANRPLLMEMVGYLHFVRWDSWAELNKKTAQNMGIREGDWIWIESTTGKLKTRAKLSETVMPGVVLLPLGLGHTAYGRYARDAGVNPNEIISLQKDPLTGQIVQHNMRVRVYRHEAV